METIHGNSNIVAVELPIREALLIVLPGLSKALCPQPIMEKNIHEKIYFCEYFIKLLSYVVLLPYLHKLIRVVSLSRERSLRKTLLLS